MIEMNSAESGRLIAQIVNLFSEHRNPILDVTRIARFFRYKRPIGGANSSRARGKVQQMFQRDKWSRTKFPTAKINNPALVREREAELTTFVAVHGASLNDDSELNCEFIVCHTYLSIF